MLCSETSLQSDSQWSRSQSRQSVRAAKVNLKTYCTYVFFRVS